MASLKPAAKAAPRPKLERMIKHLAERDWIKARALGAELLKRWPHDVNALTLAARVALEGERDPALSLERCDAALRRAPRAPEAHRGALMALSALGDKPRAIAAAERWIAADPARAAGYYELARLAPERAAAHLPVMRSLAAAGATDAPSRAMLLNALGLMAEREGRKREAFRAFLASKAALARRYDPAPFQRFYEACAQLYTPERLAECAAETRLDPVCARRMIFVVGLPRTGSTLVERILSAHPLAEGLGETRELERALAPQDAAVGGDAPAPRLARFLDGAARARLETARAYLAGARGLARDADALRWIDKMPGNFVHCGMIAALLPEARIVMTDRDPRDAMLSCLRTLFTTGQSFTSDFESFLAHWRLQQRFAALWRARLGDRLMDMRYEDLASDPIGQGRRLVAHAGLAWDEACARPETGGGAVQTASAFQVREAVHTRSIGAWRAYEAEFAPMTAMLEGLGQAA